MVIQGTQEWQNCRTGKITASNIYKILTRTKTGYGADREHYLMQLLTERMTGQRTEIYTNSSMQWGTDQEPYARAAYEVAFDQMVDTVGFIDHPYINMAGASPDGLVGDAGLIEIKCPETKTALVVWLTGKIDDKYWHQMHWQMACTGRKWCDYAVFDPRLPGHLQLYQKRVKQCDMWVENAEKEIGLFLAELAERQDKLETLRLVREGH